VISKLTIITIVSSVREARLKGRIIHSYRNTKKSTEHHFIQYFYFTQNLTRLTLRVTRRLSRSTLTKRVIARTVTFGSLPVFGQVLQLESHTWPYSNFGLSVI